MEKEEILLSKNYFRAINRFFLIRSFRQSATLGLPYMYREVQKDFYEFIQNMAYGTMYDHLFNDKSKFFDLTGGIKPLVQMATNKNIITYEAAIDAASLVFTHSIIDNAVLEYCRVTSMISPGDWMSAVGKRNVSLDEVKETTFDVLLKKKIELYFDELEKNSLPIKVKKLLSVCKPQDSSLGIKDYKYDRDRLEKLDKMRHDIVHGDGPIKKLSNIEDDIDYLMKTNTFLAVSVFERYDMKINTKCLERDISLLFQLKK